MGCCNKEPVSRWIPPFIGWVDYNPTIPKIYWNTYSMEQRIHELCGLLHKVCCYADMLGLKVSVDHDAIEALEREFDEFKASGFLDYYESLLVDFIDENKNLIYEKFAHGVYFGLNLEGRFIAIIPDSWNDIIFDTGADYALDTYGRLIIRMDVDSPYSVDQTPEVVRPYDEAYLREQIRNIMNTLYATE